MDVVELTQKLVHFNTINPPGNEVEICRYLEGLLEEAGFETSVSSFGDKRYNLIARIGEQSNKLPLGFTGHMDTVPLGKGDWLCDPFIGMVENGRIYGRGTCDMKGGLAASICAIIECIDIVKAGPGVTLFITGGEETGSDGAKHYTEKANIHTKIGALIVAEPTDLMPLAGHKGVLWVRVKCKGKAAHGSMPAQGENAIYKMVDAVKKLQNFDFGEFSHEYLGGPTLNVGTIDGGENTNIVADLAQITVDMRTLPRQSHIKILEKLKVFLGDEFTIEPFVNLPGVWTPDNNEWFSKLDKLVSQTTGEIYETKSAPYFTDASVLTPYFDNVPTVILGPGSPQVAHTLNEYCEISQLYKSVEIYKTIISDWHKV